ncbi:MAG: hypothetical protein R3C08_14265 [Hyphomonas sp.]
MITVLTAGNLATSQAVISVLDERTKAPKERRPSLLEAPTMFQVANIIGDTLKEVIKTQKMTGPESEADFGATMIVGGEIAGMGPRLFLIYPKANFIGRLAVRFSKWRRETRRRPSDHSELLINASLSEDAETCQSRSTSTPPDILPRRHALGPAGLQTGAAGDVHRRRSEGILLDVFRSWATA